jgi:hypothetical protein
MEHASRTRRSNALGTKVCLLCLALFSCAVPTWADNIHAGPFGFTLSLNPGFTWTDNFNNSETNKLSDLSINIGPTLTMSTGLPSLGGGQLTLAMSVNYQISITGNQENTFSAPCNLSLSIPIYIYQWYVVVSDNFTFTNDPLESTWAANTNKEPQFNNTVSVTGTRQFGRYALTLGAQMINGWYPDNPTQDQWQFLFSATPSYFLREGYSVFWQNNLGFTFQNAPKQNVIGYTTGLGVSGQITPSLSGSIAVGYSWSFIQERNLGPGDGIFGGIFDPVILPAYNLDGINLNSSLNFSNPLRPNTTYTVSFFANPGITALLEDSSIQSTYGVNLGLSHRLSRGITLSPRVSWQHMEDAGPQDLLSGPRERADILQLSISFSKPLTRKLGSNLTYRFQQRNSNLPGQSYQVNQVTGSLSYTF